jgi:HAD superfamily phosphoserine phosphatase-like hydrolase
VGGGGIAQQTDLEARWRSGALGHRDLTIAECAHLRCDERQALDFVRSFAVDPGFPPFARRAAERGDAVCVVSEGFEFYIRLLLEREGLGALPISSNRLHFEGGGARPEFPNAERSCGRCGNCKGAEVARWQERGYRTVLIGDGLSDRCGARAADVVLARGDLLEWCRREGVAALDAPDFSAAGELTERLAGAAEGA